MGEGGGERDEAGFGGNRRRGLAGSEGDMEEDAGGKYEEEAQ